MRAVENPEVHPKITFGPLLKNNGFFPVCAPKLSGCILFAHLPDTRANFLRNDLLSNDTCSETGGLHSVL